MATLQSPLVPPVHQTISSTDPKLRVSCNNCSASKIKCSKEKPTCARCSKRSMVCQYSEIKRSGRKLGSCLSNPSPSPDVMQPPTNSPPMGSLDVSADVSPVDPMVSTLATLNYHFDEVLGSPFSFSMVDMADAGDLIGSSQFHDPSDVSNLIDFSKDTHFLSMNNPPSSMTTPAVPELAPPSSAPSQEPINNWPVITDEFNSGPVCCFLVRSLELLKQSHSPVSAACHACRGQSFENYDTLGQLSTIQPVIAYIDQSIQAISDILQCHCSQDGYVLAILSIFILKILDWYAAMVRQTPDLEGYGQIWDNAPSKHQAQHQPENIQWLPAVVAGDDCADGEDQGRMAAQQILGKLHRIQRLVNIISQRFNNQKDIPNSSTTNSSDVFLFLFSRSSLEQIEVDLRKRLQNLSAETVDMLR
jgi:hypothetical protein